ncbi:MAG TPA: hypothetical protein VFI43_05205 [Nitrosospira sp.]|nr:hypothetical protein [Nitrosospira sp.]
MNKFISTVILTAFTAVFSFGATAADSSNDNTTGNSSDKKEKWEKKYGKGGKGDDSTSEIMKNKEPKDLSPDEKYEYRDQETMNKKPYKQTK